MLMSYRGLLPQVDPTAYISPSAQVIGDVVIGAHSSVWFNVVIRGDVHHIRIGARTNIQDNSTVHVTRGRWGTVVGDDVTVAHGVILHGCRIGSRCLIGMGAIIMDGAVIHSNSIIAAGAVVLEGTIVESGSVWAGMPARKVKDIDERLLEGQVNRISSNYQKYASWYD